MSNQEFDVVLLAQSEVSFHSHAYIEHIQAFASKILRVMKDPDGITSWRCSRHRL